MQRFLFFHGGPAFNGNPERHILTEPFRLAGFDLACWDEPSAMRPNGFPFTQENAFQNSLVSAENFLLEHYENTGSVFVMAFCFGTHAVYHLVRKHPEKIKGVVIVSPDYCLASSDYNIFCHVQNDYMEHDSTKAEAMQEIIKNYTGKFDENAEQGWLFAAENPRLFNYYWFNHIWKEQYLQYYVNEYAIDGASFFSVRKTWQGASKAITDIPTLILYGKEDRILSIEEEIKQLPYFFRNYKLVELDNAGHYPHIEQTGDLLKNIQKFFLN